MIGRGVINGKHVWECQLKVATGIMLEGAVG